MNFVISLALLVLAVSCGKSSKKESCTYNGQSTPCSEMPRPQIDSLKGTILKAQVTAAITQDISKNKFEIIENSFNSSSASAGALNFSCGLQTYMGDVVNYKITNGHTDLILNNQKFRLKQLDGVKNSILGLWTGRIAKNGIERIIQVSILHNSIKIDLTCTVL